MTWHYDPKAVNRVLNFFEKRLHYTADQWYGQPFKLMPWQKEALRDIFGRFDEDGNRTIELAYLEIPKKSGKTEFTAGILLYILYSEAMPGCQVFGAAASKDQGKNVYNAACSMIRQNQQLEDTFEIFAGTNRIVKRNDPHSFYAVVAADGDLADGKNPAFVVADEVHRWRNRKQLENWAVLTNGGITRKQTLTIAITTAGVMDESPLAWMLHEKTEKLSLGIVEDPKFFGRIYGAAIEDDPSLESTWIKANPSLEPNGGFIPVEKIRERYVAAVAEGDLTSFKRYFLNIWGQVEDKAIDIAQWDSCPRPFISQGVRQKADPIIIHGKIYPRTVRPLPQQLLNHFAGRRCWAGVDLSMTTDLSSVAFVFPKDDGYEVLPFFWMPMKNIKRTETRLSVPLRRWAEEGFIELCPGDAIDYREIQARLEWGASLFNLEEICWDPWNSRQISVPMLENGYRCKEVRQGYASLSEATKKLLELVAVGKFYHGDHPVLRWHAGCAATATDGRDNIIFVKPDRNKSASRIDGIAAIVNALAVAIGSQEPSISLSFI